MESDPGVRDVSHDIVLADGEVVGILGTNTSVQEGPLATFFHSGRSRVVRALRAERVASFTTTDIRRIIRLHPPTLRTVPVDGAERAFGNAAG